jgi:hypothetical protein
MNTAETPDSGHAEPGRHPATVQVSVYTTSGAFPAKGQEKVESTEVIADFLSKAAKALHLTDTTGWVATVDGREINTARSFAEDGLRGSVKIHWGPREGGGG